LGIKKLKNNKACGEDLVINEYIKSTTNTFIDIYEQLFNIIFETVIGPSLRTLSNALSKSIKAQNILFFLFLRISKKLKVQTSYQA
jgi:hypothetical protein